MKHACESGIIGETNREHNTPNEHTDLNTFDQVRKELTKEILRKLRIISDN